MPAKLPKRILCIGISAPPKSGAESIQFTKYLNAFGEKGISLDLLSTPVPSAGWKQADHDLEEVGTYLDQVYFISDDTDSPYMKLLIRLGKSFHPDRHFRFGRKSAQAVKLIKNKPDVIYCRAMPFSGAIMASQLSEYFRIPLILHLADPYTLNPYLTFKDDQTARNLEETIFSKAHIIAFTTELTRKLYQETYPGLSGKMKVYPNVYQASDIQLDAPLPDKFTIRYTGNLYGDRNLKPLINAVRQMAVEQPGFTENSRIIISGRFENSLEVEMKESGVSNLEITKPYPYKESLSKQKDAHLLVSVDKPMSSRNDLVFLPSKLLDYACTGRPILNVSSPGSESEKLIQAYHLGESFGHDDSAGISAYIKTVFSRYSEGHTDYFSRRTLPEDYFNKKVVDRLLLDLALEE